MDDLSLSYYGYVFDASGYGEAARAYIHALDSARVRLSVVDLAGNGRQVRDPLVESLVGRRIDSDFHLFHGIPSQWARLASRRPNVIGMTVWETDTMPAEWRAALDHTLEVWLPCEYNVAVFGRSLAAPAFKLPHPVFRSGSGGATRRFEAGESDFVFYSIFEWQDRKCPAGTIEAFLRAFPERSTPLLVLKTNPAAASVARETLDDLRRRTGSDARVRIHAERWEASEIAALHERGDCYVSLHRGEGWGYPLFDAASRGTPVIATGYSGPTEYLTPEAHRLVRYTLGTVAQRYVYYRPTMRWADPDLSHASELMREVFERPDAARARASVAAASIANDYSLEAIGAAARTRLLRLLGRTQPRRWRRAMRTADVAPETPIPAAWYDEDYFETGLKSNWSGGYTWSPFGALFRETAAYLTASFPEAESFLDVGCAKGFLVRSLREAGKECWGLDHSPWAVARAEPSVREFVVERGVEDATFEREFDVLVALSLMESLTEEQALSFLTRARAWTRQAILATVACREDGERGQGDMDASHVTMRSRAFWHELFLSAGWRQDALHRVAERACRAHALPTRMGWEVFVYSPGR